LIYRLIYSIILLSPLFSFGQNPVFFNITTEDNLPSNDVYSILQDKDGLIWLGTDAGLYKFNGVSYEYFHHPYQKFGAVTGLVLANDHRIYFYNFNNQIFYVEKNKVLELKHSFSKIGNLSLDKQSNVWINHLDGLSKWQKDQNKWITITSKITNSSIQTIDGRCILAHHNGIDFLQNNKVKSVTNNMFSKFNLGQLLLVNQDKTVWLFESVMPSIFKIRNDSIKSIVNISLINKLRNRKVTNARTLLDGNIWICTYSGIIRFNPETHQSDLFYENISFTDCLLDREKNYWFTSLYNGCFIVPNSKVLVLNEQNGFLKNEKTKNIIHFKNKLYFNTIDGSIGEIDFNKNSIPKIFQSPTKGDINALFVDSKNGNLYFNINQNFYSLSNGVITKLHSQSYPVKCLTAANGKYFIGTSSGLLIQDYIKAPHTNNFIIKDWINAFSYDSISKTMYVASRNGIYNLKFVNDKFQIIQQILPKKQVITLVLNEPQQTLYCITSENEIFSYKNNSLQKINSFEMDVIVKHCIFFQNQLLIACNKGIKILNLNTKKWSKITKEKGLASNDIKQLLIVNNQIWAATSKGLHIIPVEFNEKKTLAKILLKQIQKNNEIIEIKNIQIKHKDELKIKIDVSNYSSFGKYQIAYRINESKWIFNTASAENIYLSNLPTGNTKVQIKAIDIDENDSVNIITLNLKVHPPFWQKWWFIALLLLTLFMLVYLIFKWRLKNLKKQQINDFEQVNLKNELLISQEIALKAQMKPHFVFNVLNSIKAFIYENDKENSIKYLKLFSDLVRNILEMSSNPKIRLADEIKTLNNYIQLEELLLDDTFKFNLIIDKNIDTSEVEIPSLIIQPFVENAFKHGLRHKKGDKELQILIEQEKENLLKVTIGDNGIGRKAAQIINQNTARLHKSFAMETSKKRIDLLNLKNIGLIGVEYEDLLDSNQNALGTKVILRINLYD